MKRSIRQCYQKHPHEAQFWKPDLQTTPLLALLAYAIVHLSELASVAASSISFVVHLSFS